ncbi:hypothetical protein BD626DRAFT_632251 [Schizophyllum amplum]|uniref:Uncharacterized protein n=1 Tax=Schizophyllum amplum TaxID=97359 RepID=A0A550C7Q4_9AGAR|nr:hypothetical protein BD626DRAFT_632251 [Auriculariopsis ampla]
MYAASHSPATSSCRRPVVASTGTDQATRSANSISSPPLETERDHCHGDDDESTDNASDDGDYATDASQDADFDKGDEGADGAADLVDISEKEFVRKLASSHEDTDDDKRPNSMSAFPDEEHFVIMRPDDDQVTHDEPTPIHESSPWADFDAALSDLPTVDASARAADDDNDDDDDDGEYEEVTIPDAPRPPVTPTPVLRCFNQTSSATPTCHISPLRFRHPRPGDPSQRSSVNPLQISPKKNVAKGLSIIVVESSTQEVDQGCLTLPAHVQSTTTLPCKTLSIREQRIKEFRTKHPRGKHCLDDYDQCNGWCYRDLTHNELGPIHAQRLVERDVYSRYWRVIDRVKRWDGKIRILYVHVHDPARRPFEETVVRTYGPLFMARPIPDEKAKSLLAKKPKKEQDESVTIMARAEAQKKATARKNIEKEAQAEAERKANQQGSKALPIEIEDSDGEDTYASGRTTNAGASAPNASVGQLPEAAAPPSEGDSQPHVWHFSVPIHAPSPTQGPPCGLGAPTPSTTTDASNFTGSIFSAAWGAQVRAQEASTPAQWANPVAHSSQSPCSIAPTVASSLKTEAQDQQQIAPRREPGGIPRPSPSEPRFDIPPPVPQRMRVPEVLLDEADVQTMQLPPESPYKFRAFPKTSKSQSQPCNEQAPAAFEESSSQRNHHDELMKGVDHIKGQRRQTRNLPRQRPYSPPSTKPQLSMERQSIVHPDALAQQHPDTYAQPPMYGMPPQQMPHLPPLYQEFVQLRYDGQPIEERLAEVQEWRRQQAIQQQRQQAILRHQQQQQQLRRHWQQRQASQDQHQRPAIVVNINYYNGSAMASGPQMVGLVPHSENLQMGARQAMQPPPQAYHVQSDVSADPHLNGGQGEGAQFHQPQHAQQAGTYQHTEQPVPSTNDFPYDAQAPLQESAHHELRQAPSTRSEPQQYHASFGNINHASALPSHAGLRPSFAVPTATPTPGPSRTYSAASRVSSQAEFGESASVAGPSIQRGCVSPEPGSLDPYYSSPTPFVPYPAAGPSRMHVGPATPTTAPYATKLESDSPQWYTCKALVLKRKNADPHERHGRGGHGPPEGDWNL